MVFTREASKPPARRTRQKGNNPKAKTTTPTTFTLNVKGPQPNNAIGKTPPQNKSTVKVKIKPKGNEEVVGPQKSTPKGQTRNKRSVKKQFKKLESGKRGKIKYSTGKVQTKKKTSAKRRPKNLISNKTDTQKAKQKKTRKKRVITPAQREHKRIYMIGYRKRKMLDPVYVMKQRARCKVGNTLRHIFK